MRPGTLVSRTVRHNYEYGYRGRLPRFSLTDAVPNYSCEYPHIGACESSLVNCLMTRPGVLLKLPAGLDWTHEYEYEYGGTQTIITSRVVSSGPQVLKWPGLAWLGLARLGLAWLAGISAGPSPSRVEISCYLVEG
jgi:hypothetical protein